MMSEISTAPSEASASASGQYSGPVSPPGMPHFASAHPIIAVNMNSVGIVKFRKLRMPMVSVKASATVKAGDFGGLRALAEVCGDRFAFGAVLYDSTDVVPFGDRLVAAPLSCLWG